MGTPRDDEDAETSAKRAVHAAGCKCSGVAIIAQRTRGVITLSMVVHGLAGTRVQVDAVRAYADARGLKLRLE